MTLLASIVTVIYTRLETPSKFCKKITSKLRFLLRTLNTESGSIVSNNRYTVAGSLGHSDKSVSSYSPIENLDRPNDS